MEQSTPITEKPCTRCKVIKSLEHFHKDSRLPTGVREVCKPCRIETDKNYYSKTLIRRKTVKKEWYIKNKDKCAERDGVFYKRNREKKIEKDRRYYKKNKALVDKRAKEWRKNNPEAAKSLSNNRRARILKAEGTHTKEDIAFLLAKQKCKCAICRKNVKKGYDLDHIQPISKGGRNDIKNLQILCMHCNRRKRAKDPMDFMRENGFLL